ncbi:MAG TPA: PRC-barrel domain-containing protein [Gemmatimonadaceae bacterium]|nr:PRC-barrel domain-containing protein [Gemmatimonadaceae bacterium]
MDMDRRDTDRSDRKGRDAAGVGPYATEREKLVPLRSLDSWTVSEGEPDIRGWELRTVSGRQLGTVNDLLIDPDANEVVMLDIDLPGRQDHTFVPIRIAQIDRARRVVLMDSADLTLPEGAFADRPPASVTDPSAPRTIRYPQYEREVPVDRPIAADAAPPSDAMPPDSSLERRGAERRRIDRLSTDI